MKRRWFQIHLSTAVVLMFVAGGLMWANLRARKVEWDGSNIGYVATRSPAFDYGWPQVILNDHYEWKTPFDRSDLTDETYKVQWWRYDNLAINIATALALFCATAFMCEWSIRRREARAP